MMMHGFANFKLVNK